MTVYTHAETVTIRKSSFAQWTNRTSIDVPFLRPVRIHFQQMEFEFEKFIHSMFEFLDSGWSCWYFFFQLLLPFSPLHTWLNNILMVTINWQYNPSNQNVNNENIEEGLFARCSFFEFRAVGVKFSWQHNFLFSSFTIQMKQKQKMNEMSSFIFVHHLIGLTMAKAPPTTIEFNLTVEFSPSSVSLCFRPAISLIQPKTIGINWIFIIFVGSCSAFGVCNIIMKSKRHIHYTYCSIFKWFGGSISSRENTHSINIFNMALEHGFQQLL